MQNENKKTAPDACTIKSGRAGKKHSGRVILPCAQNSTGAGDNQVITPLLLPGAENAISTPELQRITGLDVRSIRSQVSKERASGALILSSSSGGYYLPAEGEEGRNELQRFIGMILSKALNTLKAAEAARNALRVLSGQQFLEGLEDEQT